MLGAAHSVGLSEPEKAREGRLRSPLSFSILGDENIRIETKQCTKCKKVKSLDKFSFVSLKTGKRNTRCKSCISDYEKERYKLNRERLIKQSRGLEEVKYKDPVWAKTKRLMGQYKLPYGIYLEMIENGCEVCGNKENLCVDHDHSCCPGQTTCGRCIRGILCTDCNMAEGRLKSSIEISENMVVYLKTYELVKEWKTMGFKQSNIISRVSLTIGEYVDMIDSFKVYLRGATDNREKARVAVIIESMERIVETLEKESEEIRNNWNKE